MPTNSFFSTLGSRFGALAQGAGYGQSDHASGVMAQASREAHKEGWAAELDSFVADTDALDVDIRRDWKEYNDSLTPRVNELGEELLVTPVLPEGFKGTPEDYEAAYKRAAENKNTHKNYLPSDIHNLLGKERSIQAENLAGVWPGIMGANKYANPVTAEEGVTDAGERTVDYQVRTADGERGILYDADALISGARVTDVYAEEGDAGIEKRRWPPVPDSARDALYLDRVSKIYERGAGSRALLNLARIPFEDEGEGTTRDAREARALQVVADAAEGAERDKILELEETRAEYAKQEKRLDAQFEKDKQEKRTELEAANEKLKATYIANALTDREARITTDKKEGQGYGGLQGMKTTLPHGNDLYEILPTINEIVRGRIKDSGVENEYLPVLEADPHAATYPSSPSINILARNPRLPEVLKEHVSSRDEIPYDMSGSQFKSMSKEQRDEQIRNREILVRDNIRRFWVDTISKNRTGVVAMGIDAVMDIMPRTEEEAEARNNVGLLAKRRFMREVNKIGNQVKEGLLTEAEGKELISDGLQRIKARGTKSVLLTELEEYRAAEVPEDMSVMAYDRLGDNVEAFWKLFKVRWHDVIDSPDVSNNGNALYEALRNDPEKLALFRKSPFRFAEKYMSVDARTGNVSIDDSLFGPVATKAEIKKAGIDDIKDKIDVEAVLAEMERPIGTLMPSNIAALQAEVDKLGGLNNEAQQKLVTFIDKMEEKNERIDRNTRAAIWLGVLSSFPRGDSAVQDALKAGSLFVNTGNWHTAAQDFVNTTRQLDQMDVSLDLERDKLDHQKEVLDFDKDKLANDKWEFGQTNLNNLRAVVELARGGSESLKTFVSGLRNTNAYKRIFNTGDLNESYKPEDMTSEEFRGFTELSMNYLTNHVWVTPEKDWTNAQRIDNAVATGYMASATKAMLRNLSQKNRPKWQAIIDVILPGDQFGDIGPRAFETISQLVAFDHSTGQPTDEASKIGYFMQIDSKTGQILKGGNKIPATTMDSVFGEFGGRQMLLALSLVNHEKYRKAYRISQ